VALFGSFPPHPVTFVGGVEASTWNLIQGLREIGETDIHVVTLNSSIDQRRTEYHDGVGYHYLPTRNRWQTVTLYRTDTRRVLSTLDDIAPDVVHAQSSQVYGFIALKSSYPVVVSVHGIVAEEAKFLDDPRDRLRALMRSRVVQRHVVTNSRHLIQPTRYPERYFAGLRTGIWHDTGNAIGRRFFTVERQPERGRILYAGAVIPRKRLADLIEAVPLMGSDEVRLRVAGPTPHRTYHAELQSRADELGIRDRVEFLGPLDPGEMLEEYRRCVALTLPSGQETSPMVIAEAMATGTPVVATRVGGVSDLVDEGATGFIVDVGDIPATAAAVSKLVTSADLVAEMGKRSRAKAEAEYRSDVVARRVRAVYTRALADAGHAS
jgi:glycosyltransferase involved in cell wall biosynthesis